MKKLFIFMFLLFAFAYGNTEKVINYNIEDYPFIYDPQHNTETTAGDILSYVFEGLTKLDAKGNPIPAVAQSWSNNGNVWTFKLRQSAKWHNGDPVVAKDFVDAWERALNPETTSDYSFLMYCIKGAQEYNEGTYKKFTSVGVRAIDNYTLQVTLKEPVIYFPSLVSFYTFYPQNSKFIKTLKDIEYGSSYSDILGNGAFKIYKSKNSDDLSLKKSDKYWNKDNIKIDTINFLTFSDEDIFKEFEAKKIDIATLNSETFIANKDSKYIHSYEDGSVWYLTLNTNNELFSNKKIRNALAMAIDREALVNDAKDGLGSVAESFIPVGIKGKKDFFRNEYPQSSYGISYNPKKAKELFEEGLNELNIDKSDIVSITILCGNSEIAIADAEFYAEQLENTLDLDIELDPVTFADRLSRSSAGDYDIVISGWGPDYNDPLTYLDMFTSESTVNYSAWYKEGYDNLISTIKNEKNPDKRMDLLAQAEKILMEELPIIPIYFRKKAVLINPSLGKVNFNIFSPSIDFVE